MKQHSRCLTSARQGGESKACCHCRGKCFSGLDLIGDTQLRKVGGEASPWTSHYLCFEPSGSLS